MEVLKLSKVEGDELWVGLALEGVCCLGVCLVSPCELPLWRKPLSDLAFDSLEFGNSNKSFDDFPVILENFGEGRIIVVDFVN